MNDTIAAHHAAVAPDAGVKSKRVLLVEDHDDLRTFLVHLLESAGYEVIVAHDYRHGESHLTSTGFDLLISNIVLPRGSGIGLAEIAGAKGVKWLLMTGHPNQIQLMDEQKKPYLAKPFRPGEFLERVHQICST